MVNESKIEMACFNLIAQAIQVCFTPIRKQQMGEKCYETNKQYKRFTESVKEIRIKFACSDIVKIWCDCAENFEYKKLRQLIIDYNEGVEIKKSRLYEKMSEEEYRIKKIRYS